jgi:hypothetical protein
MHEWISDDEREPWKGEPEIWVTNYGPNDNPLSNSIREYMDYMAAWARAQDKRKRPAELDDKDRKNPWGHLGWHG